MAVVVVVVVDYHGVVVVVVVGGGGGGGGGGFKLVFITGQQFKSYLVFKKDKNTLDPTHSQRIIIQVVYAKVLNLKNNYVGLHVVWQSETLQVEPSPSKPRVQLLLTLGPCWFT